MAPRYPDVGAAIKKARLRKKLSQEQAAKLVGTSRFHWIRWEQGLHRPTEYAGRLGEVLGLPEDVFGDESDDPTTAEEEFLEAFRPVAKLWAAKVERRERSAA